jgi:RND superfamily putative drug exporter
VAISASIGVLLVMLASLTLLPALLTLTGPKVARGGRRARKRAAQRMEDGLEPAGGGAGNAWLRWSAFVQRRPRTIAAIAAPATALRLGSSDASSDPSGKTTHRAASEGAEG